MGILGAIQGAAASVVGFAQRFAEPTKSSGGAIISLLTNQQIKEQPTWATSSRIGGSMTPQMVSEILRNADMGRFCSLVDLVHECREKDGHLQSVLETREQSLSAIPWSITTDPYSKASLAEKRRAARANKNASKCELALRRAKAFSMAREHLNGESLLFGHSTAEIRWRMAEPEDGPELKGLLIPDEFIPVSTRRFALNLQTSALLYDPYSDFGGQSDVTSTGVDLLSDYPAGKFIQVRRRINGDVLAREGLCRALLWEALFRNWGIRDWLEAAQLSWKPWRLGKYSKGADKDDIALLKQIMLSLTSTGSASMPETLDVTIEWPKGAALGSQSLHQELCNFMAAEMSKLVLGQTMTTEAGIRGARSLGETQADNSLKPRLRADAEAIDAYLTQQYVVPFYLLNFGSYDGAAFVSQTQDEANFLEFTQGIKTLREAGHPVQQSWVRDEIGQPDPQAGEPMLGDGETDEGDGNNGGGTADGSGDGESNQSDSEEPNPKSKPTK